MESGSNNEFLRHETAYLAGRFDTLIFSTDEAKKIITESNAPRLSVELCKRTSDTHLEEFMVDYYKDDPEARKFVPESMALPAYSMIKSSEPDVLHITPEGNLPGMFVDVNGDSCYLITEYFLNAQGDSVRRLSVMNEGNEFTEDEIQQEGIMKVDHPVINVTVETPFSKGEFEYIGGMLMQVEQGEYTDPRYHAFSSSSGRQSST